MDGKGMMRFMRASRLLRRRKRSHNSSRQIAPGIEIAGEKSVQACRVWNQVLTGLEKYVKTISDIESIDDLRRYLDALVAASNQFRTAISCAERRHRDGTTAKRYFAAR